MERGSDLAIIGGGIVGLWLAWHFARLGKSVNLFEAKTCGQEATAASLGVLWPPSPTRNQDFHSLHRKSLSMLPACLSDLQLDGQVDCGYEELGGLELLNTKSQFDMAEKELALSKSEPWRLPIQMQSSLLNPDQIIQLEPNLHKFSCGAALIDNVGRVIPDKIIGCLKRACLKYSVNILEFTPANEFNTYNSSVRVNTDQGTFYSKHLIVSAGIKTHTLNPCLQKYALTDGVKGQALLLRTRETLIRHIIKSDRRYLIPWGNNIVAVGSTTEFNPKSGHICSKINADLVQFGCSILPELSEAEVFKSWIGYRPATKDRLPCIGAIPGLDNCYVATGHYKIGFGLLPVTAEILENLILRGLLSESPCCLRPRIAERLKKGALKNYERSQPST